MTDVVYISRPKHTKCFISASMHARTVLSVFLDCMNKRYLLIVHHISVLYVHHIRDVHFDRHFRNFHKFRLFSNTGFEPYFRENFR